MTIKEADQFLALVSLAYPSAYKNMGAEIAQATTNMWQNTFREIPYIVMELALERYRRKSKFAPSVAEIIEELKSMYYIAYVDASAAKVSGDEELLRKSLWLMEHTSPRRFEEEAPIRYSLITKEMLCLPEGGDQYG